MPILPVWQMRGRRLDLLGLRRLFLHAGVGLVEIAIILPATIERRAAPMATWAWVVLGIAVLWSVAGIAWTDRPFKIDEERALQPIGDQFQALCYMRLGLAASPALWGIAFGFLAESPDPAYVGTAASVGLLAWSAPRSSRLDRVDAQLRAAGITTTIRQGLADR